KALFEAAGRKLVEDLDGVALGHEGSGNGQARVRHGARIPGGGAGVDEQDARPPCDSDRRRHRDARYPAREGAATRSSVTTSARMSRRAAIDTARAWDSNARSSPGSSPLDASSTRHWPPCAR